MRLLHSVARVHLRARPPDGRRRAEVSDQPGRDAAVARRRGGDLRGRGLAAAPGLREGQAGSGVRAHQGRRYSVLLRGLSPLVATLSTPLAAPVIVGIDEVAWTPIHYPHAIWDDDAGCWITDVEVAETGYTAFAGTRHQVAARLVVRRIRREPPPGLAPGLGEPRLAHRHRAVHHRRRPDPLRPYAHRAGVRRPD